VRKSFMGHFELPIFYPNLRDSFLLTNAQVFGHRCWTLCWWTSEVFCNRCFFFVMVLFMLFIYVVYSFCSLKKKVEPQSACGSRSWFFRCEQSFASCF